MTRAVVLGGGMAGLLAARVLAAAHTEVTIVDRDDVAGARGQRRGAPHAGHIHALLPRGQTAVEELFPGLLTELLADGAVRGDLLGDTRLFFSGHRLRRGRCGLDLFSASRPFLESRVRDRVAAAPNVAFAPPADITGLATAGADGRVTGARVVRRADGSTAEVIEADLVVDATGRGSRAPRWLEELGHPSPAEEKVTIDLGYSTARFRLADAALDGDVGCLVAPVPGHGRGGVLARLEDGTWMLTLAGVLGDHPPVDLDGYRAFAASLPIPDIHRAIRDAEPETGPIRYRFPASVRRRFDTLRRVPEGFTVLGDAMCSVNPIYGQGMTVAALQALALRRHLERHGRVRPAGLLWEFARANSAAWETATGADLGFPGAQGRRTPMVRLLNGYVARLHAVAAHDSDLAAAFLRVSSLVDAPPALMRPGVALRVLGRARG